MAPPVSTYNLHRRSLDCWSMGPAPGLALLKDDLPMKLAVSFAEGLLMTPWVDLSLSLLKDDLPMKLPLSFAEGLPTNPAVRPQPRFLKSQPQPQPAAPASRIAQPSVAELLAKELLEDGPKDEPKTSLLVSYLPRSATPTDLKRSFSSFGEVSLVRIVYNDDGLSKCYGFVNFADPKAAVQAMHKCSKGQVIMMDGDRKKWHVKATWAELDGPRRASRRRGGHNRKPQV